MEMIYKQKYGICCIFVFAYLTTYFPYFLYCVNPEERVMEGFIKKQISPAQRVRLIEFVEEHPELVKQKHSNQHTNADARRLWIDISQKLNCIPGANKSWEEWRKTWRDLKNRTKKKKAEDRREMNKTGGGPNRANGIDEIDNKILDIMGGEIVIEGLVNIPEAGIPLVEQMTVENLENTNTALGDHNIYCIIEEKTEENQGSDLGETTNNIPYKVKDKTSKLGVRPPKTNHKNTPTTSIRGIRQNAAQAAADLVRVTVETNTIKQNYYEKRIKIMEESLEIQKQNLNVQERIASGIEHILTKLC